MCFAGFYCLNTDRLFFSEGTAKHDRLSVKPIGKISFITDDASIEIVVRNDGTGPMLVSNIKVYDDESDIKNNLRDALPILQMKNNWTVVNMGTQFTISAGEQKTLLKISSDRKTREFRDYFSQVMFALKNTTLELAYRDIYDQHIGTLKREGFRRPEH